MLENAHATPGTEVTLVWGEPGRGSTKPTVERHTQAEIRATVAPVPISEETDPALVLEIIARLLRRATPALPPGASK